MEPDFESIMRNIPALAQDNGVTVEKQMELLLQAYFEGNKKLCASRDYWRDKSKFWRAKFIKRKLRGEVKVPLAQLEKMRADRDIYERAYRREFNDNLRLLREARKTK